ncbi:MAG: peptidase MA family metallohydrolase [Chloroflexi bacterium]|nr:peptidase MA family metallohydrolase [Chloroflexota bacterium]
MRRVSVLLGIAAISIAAMVAAISGLGTAEAQQSEIQILNHRVDTNFPTDVKFFIEVAGPDEIEEVRVIMKTIGQTTRSAYRQVEFEPGITVSGEAELLTSGNNYVPPGTRMAYSFEVRDTAGRVLQTEEQVFVYLDTRFEWFTVSEGIVTVYYNDPLVKSRAEHVLETALESMRITGPLLGINPELPLHIVTYHNYREMFGALPFRSQATSSQLITAGMAFDEERVLMVHSGSGSVTSTTAHEFVHLLVGDALGRAYPQAPAWLNEGLAEYGSYHGGNREILNGTVKEAIDKDRLRPLWHLGSYSGTPEEILYAYGHGDSVVTFMVQKYGEEKMSELMKALKRTLDIDSSLMAVYGLDQHGIDSAWRQEIGLDPLPKPEAPSRRPLLENIPDSTVAPILMPTFAPKQIEPAASSDPEPVPTHAPADSTMRPTPEPTAAPEASVVEPAASETRSEAPEPQAPSESTPEAANGGCGPPSVQGGFVGEIALLLVLGTPFGLVLGRRWGIWKL